ncbi:MAG: PPC domain-containing DNA-binding protein [Minisyncoccia bacterium]
MKNQPVNIRQTYMLRLIKDEKVHDTIINFCIQEKIYSGTFSAIGAIKNVELGYYDLEKRAYFWKQYPHDVEVVSLMGNITLVNEVPFLHIHTTISDTENSTYGGHLNSAEVAVTLEVRLDAFVGVLHRELDECVGLKLIAL